MVGLHAAPALEGLDPRVTVPRAAVDLVAAHVQVRVGEQRGHLADEAVEERVELLARGIHAMVVEAELALDLVRPGRARQLGMSDEPAPRVARHVELRHDADAAVARVLEDLARFLGRVEVPVRAQAVKPREARALDAEPLVLGQVPVQDVELHRGHAVQVALDHLWRLPVPAAGQPGRGVNSSSVISSSTVYLTGRGADDRFPSSAGLVAPTKTGSAG